MKTVSLLVVAFLTARCLFAQINPIALHPENPHYFIYHGKPTILITSGEHCGALSPGQYVYSLVVDGKKVDSKKMLLAK